MLEPQTLKFLADLSGNNNKPWFDEHRPQYEAARIDFQNFITLLIADLQRTDPSLAGLTARDCLFRINRDVRFSNDKSPYKPNMGASIKRGGRKSPFAGYYFHLEPGKSFVGGGLWMPDAPALKKVRQEIDYNREEFEGIINAPAFKKTYKDLYRGSDQSLSGAPKGYEKDHPSIGYIRLKSFIAEMTLPDEALLQATLHKKSVAAFQTLYPFICFINRALEE